MRCFWRMRRIVIARQTTQNAPINANQRTPLVADAGNEAGISTVKRCNSADPVTEGNIMIPARARNSNTAPPRNSLRAATALAFRMVGLPKPMETSKSSLLRG